MSDIFEMTQKVSPLYDQPIIERKNLFVCPVCKKEYKTENGATKHMAEKNCYDFADVFGDTVIEEDAYIVMKENGIRFAHRKAFRGSRIYKSSIRYILSCREHKIDAPDIFFKWLVKTLRCSDKPLLIMSRGQDEGYIRKYRVWLHKNPNLIDPVFAQRHEDDLCSDPLFFIRSLERAHITFDHIFDSEKLKEAASSLPFDYTARMEKLYEQVNN